MAEKIGDHIARGFQIRAPQDWPIEFDEAGNLISIADKHRQVQCRVCDDKGLVRKKVDVDHPDFGKAFPCPNPSCGTVLETRMRKVEKLMKTSGIEKAYKKFSFQTWDMLPMQYRKGKLTARYALEMYTIRRGEPFALSELWSIFPRGELRDACKKRYEHSTVPKAGIVLAGINGTSKTGLMASAAAHLANNGYPVLFVNILEILGRIFKAYDYKHHENAAELTADLKNADHFFGDELTFEAKDSHRRHLQEITRFRHDRDLPMCFTTNLVANEFEEWFGAQVATGIFGKCHWIGLGGEIIRHEIDPATGEGEPF